jgi:hypothetical protein
MLQFDARWHLQIRNRVTTDDAVIHAVLEANHEMRSGLDQRSQEIEGEVAAIKQIGPTGAKLQCRRRFQVVDTACGREDKLMSLLLSAFLNTRRGGFAIRLKKSMMPAG